MEGYLKGYYGYKNFGDEILFFDVVQRIFDHYPLSTLFVEVGNVDWMEDWIRNNYQGLLSEQQLKKIKIVSINQYGHKIIGHLLNFLGLGKYTKTFKFFGGGEVLCDERPFPHDGWNIPLLFHHDIKKGQFVLLGGIGKITSSWTARLYQYLLPKADQIVVREQNSATIAKKYQSHENVILYQDFAQKTIEYLGSLFKKNTLPNHQSNYILININKDALKKPEYIKDILTFCAHHHHHKKIFFPCDINDDLHCYLPLKKYIPDLTLYDWTHHSLQDSLSLFYHAIGGIGARLHFLLPLKLYHKPLVTISSADKITKLINH